MHLSSNQHHVSHIHFFAIICLLSHFQQVTAASIATCSDNEIMNNMFLLIAALKKTFFFLLFSSGLKNIKKKKNLLIIRMNKSLFQYHLLQIYVELVSILDPN
jgi:hypothetical protein